MRPKIRAESASVGTVAARPMAVALLLLGAASAACSALFPAPVAQQGADGAAVADDDGQLGATADAATPDAANPDTATPDTASPDTATPDTASPDTATPDTACSCPSNEVMRDGPCVPNPMIGCTLPCLGKAPSACPSQSVCDEAAAHQPCAPDQPAPACVPQQAMGFSPGDLRIQPTTATVGQEVTVLAMGGDFYIGALMWWMRIGGEGVMGNEYDAHCVLSAKFTPKAAGVYPIEVGYGGAPQERMNQGWTLAGFLAVGDVALGVQPGFACSANDTCASGGDWTCGCTAGRCACSKAP